MKNILLNRRKDAYLNVPSVVPLLPWLSLAAVSHKLC